MSKGMLYGVGVGPGDPELVTLKAARVIAACPVIAATKRALRAAGSFDDAELVQDCGVAGERVFRSLAEVPDESSCFSTMVVR